MIGLGYIGLPTAVVAANAGNSVLGIDVSDQVIKGLKSQQVHIEEPGLEDEFKEAVSGGRLTFASRVENADIHVIAVPTPFNSEKKPDLSYLESAALAVADSLRKGDLVIIESTIPVGTTRAIHNLIASARKDLEKRDIRIAHCPERVLPGHMLREIRQNHRVIGGISAECADMARNFYETFVTGECRVSNVETAELCKLAENAYRDVNIAFANELSQISDDFEVSVWELRKLANLHPRVNILSPGPGVGGHCIAVDPWFIVDASPAHSNLIRTAREVNDSKPQWVVDKIIGAARAQQVTEIVCLGLTYKADTDDVRESPALSICGALASHGEYRVICVDPHVRDLPASLSQNRSVEFFSDLPRTTDSSLVIFLVGHSQFRAARLQVIENGSQVMDFCGILQER